MSLSIISSVVREPGSEHEVSRPSERAVHALWSQADTLTEALITQDGQRLKVIYPGRPNSMAGPDFFDAVVQMESGETLSGDVEVHLHARDWYSHGHHTDPNYNGVILHVVLTPSDAATTQWSGITTPVAAIGPIQGEEPGRAGPNPDPDLGAILDKAGEGRFLAKSRGFVHELLATGDIDQVAYLALFEALGYSSNRRPFLQLAKRVPIKMLYAMGHEPSSTRLLGIKAMLVGAAGLLDHVKPVEDRDLLANLCRRLPRVSPIATDRWKLFRVRPTNHPVRRVLGAACLVDRFIEAGLATGMLNAVGEGGASRLIERFVVTDLIGTSRALDVVVNVVLPVVHAWAGLRRDRSLQNRCLELNGVLPPPSDNEITREMRGLMGVPKGRSLVSSARRHQGLIHLYRKHVGRITEADVAYGVPLQLCG